MTHFARRFEHVCMIPLVEESSFATEERIDRSRDAHLDSLRAARKGACVCGFNKEVQVIFLHRKMDQSKAKTLARSFERGANDHHRSITTQRREPAHHAQREMHGMMFR